MIIVQWIGQLIHIKNLLEEKGQLDYETQLYSDHKYLRIAGNTLWNGVLLILDAVFHIKSKERPHPDIMDYKNAVADRDHKLLKMVITGYETMHIAMGYDGMQQKALCRGSIALASDIIDRCAKMLQS